MTTSTVQTLGKCVDHGVDPEWWTKEHLGPCAKDCGHGLAAHICLNHCPLKESCQDQMLSSAPSEYLGMVLGGLIKVFSKGQSVIKTPRVVADRCGDCMQ